MDKNSDGLFSAQQKNLRLPTQTLSRYLVESGTEKAEDDCYSTTEIANAIYGNNIRNNKEARRKLTEQQTKQSRAATRHLELRWL